MTVFIVEVLAIYEGMGASVTNPRRNARDQDLALAANSSDKYEPGGVPPEDEYLDGFEGSRYGFGWRGRQFVTVKQTADQLGNAAYNQLNNRGMQAGSKVLIFSDDRDQEPGAATGDPSYRRMWPRANPPEPDIG